jgi:DNA-binding MarR family transcriptional regulator
MEFNYGFVLEKTGKKIKQNLQKRFLYQGLDITVDQWVILYELYLHGTQNQVALCEKVYKDAPTVTRILELLIQKDMVVRKASRADRRKFEISLSPAGRAMVKKILPEVISFRLSGWKGLSHQDMNHLTRITRKIEQNLEDVG